MKRNIKTIVLLLSFMLFPSFLSGQWEKCLFPYQFNAGIAMDSYDRNACIFSDDHSNVYKTLNDGSNWEKIAIPATMAIDLAMVDSLNIWFCSPSEIYRSSDGGQSWELQFEQSMQAMFNYLEMFNLNYGVAIA